MKGLFLIALILVFVVPLAVPVGQTPAEGAMLGPESGLEPVSIVQNIPDLGDRALFEDDFQDGQAQDWQITASWVVQQDGDRYYFLAPGQPGVAWVPTGHSWTDYVFRATVRLEEGSMAMGFRGTSEGRYWLYYRREGLYLLKEFPKGKFTSLAQTAAPALKTVHSLGILGFGGHLQVYVDKAVQLDVVDPTPLTAGTMAVVALEGSRVAVDNVLVAELTQDLPPAAKADLPAPVAPPAPAALAQQWAPVADAPALMEPPPAEPLGGVPPQVAEPAGGESPQGEDPVGAEQPQAEEPVGGEAPQAEEPSGGEEAPAAAGQAPAGLPVIDYFRAQSIAARPGCFSLSWDLHDATAAYLNGQGITAPNSTEVCQAGTYTLQAVNDAGSVERSLVLPPGGNVVQGGQPDLAFDTVSVVVSDPATPARVKVEIRVGNGGDAAAGPFTLRWYPRAERDAVGCSTDIPQLDAHAGVRISCSYTYPAADRGSVIWRAVVDADNDLAESNENNNSTNGTVRIDASAPPPPEPGSKPDLTIVWADFSPIFATSGQPFEAKMTVKNKGDAAAGAFGAQWHFQANLGLDDCSWTVEEGLPTGELKVLSCTRTTNAPGPSQEPTTLTVDPDNRVVESDEANNDSSATLLLNPASGGSKPDLVIQNPHFEPAEAVKGQPFDAVMTVKNIGAVAAGAFAAQWHFHEALGLQDCNWTLDAELAPGATKKLSCKRTTNAQPGQAPTTLTVDRDNTVVETNEANNDAGLKLTVKAAGGGGESGAGGGKPDLVIQDSHFEPAETVKGQPFDAVLTVKNTGAVAAGAFAAQWHFHETLGLQDCNWTLGAGLAPGATKKLSCKRTTNAPPGQAPTTLTVDRDNTVVETDEVNNDAGLKLTVKAAGGGGSGGGKPDLIITNATFDPPQPVKGQLFTAIMTVKNDSTVLAGAFHAHWAFPDNLGLEDCDWNLSQGLGAGTETNLQCKRTCNAPPGQTTTTLTVDRDMALAESNDTNNGVVVHLNLKAAGGSGGGKPDLVIQGPHFEPAQAVKGQPFDAVMTVKNTGTVFAPKFAAQWHFHANLGLEDCNWTLAEGLGPGASAKLQCKRTTNAQPGPAPTALTVDRDNTIAESDEANNDASLTLTVKAAGGGGGNSGAAKPDLQLTTTVKQNDPAHPEKVTVSFTVGILGGAGAGAFTIRWYSNASSDVVGCSYDVGAGAVNGGQGTCNPYTYAGIGEKHWKAVIDADKEVAESNENNNTNTGTITIGAAAGGGGGGGNSGAAKPDLVITDLRLSPATLKAGQELAVSFKVVNQGNGPAGASKAEWKTASAGGLSRTCDVPALQSGKSHACSLSFMAGPSQPMNYGTTATADVGSAVAESREDNNQAKAVLTVKP